MVDPDGASRVSLYDTVDYRTGLPTDTNFTTGINGTHVHDYQDHIRYAITNAVVGVSGTLDAVDASLNPYLNGTTASNGLHNHTVVGGDVETAPINVAVAFIIKAK